MKFKDKYLNNAQNVLYMDILIIALVLGIPLVSKLLGH